QPIKEEDKHHSLEDSSDGSNTNSEEDHQIAYIHSGIEENSGIESKGKTILEDKQCHTDSWGNRGQ
ncbi:MAG: hypothetical protein MK125_02290, partial [Dehalococcoidia bacterium]|nr:hypothetical protein [Dehalococcoidia bacterium]